MNKWIILLFLAFANLNAAEDFYSLKAAKINGDTLNFSDLKGKKLMIVNVASYCGYTYQYELLQSLYTQYKDKNFEIIAFPANNFNSQEPGTDKEIEEFCTANYGVTFTMMSKISVKAPNKHPVYQWLTLKDKNGFITKEVAWNFQKYLVSENGNLEKVVMTAVSPMDTSVTNWLNAETSEVIENTNVRDIIISPNPVINKLVINTSYEFSELEVYNSLGELVRKAPYSQKEINCEALPNGVYYLILNSNAGRIQRKFIKE